MNWVKRIYPFNAEQTVNIASEFGPLVALFVVNAVTGNVEDGTWALIGTTVIAIIAMQIVLKRLPVFPLIASTITVLFGVLTLVTHDPMWVQIKVTIFNAGFAVFLFAGLIFKKNFFKYILEKTFHYTQKGWDQFTWSFAWFFVVTAVANEIVRQVYQPGHIYHVLGMEMDGVNIWILFKIALVMPASGIYAWLLTRVMQRHAIPAPEQDRKDVVATATTAVPVAHAKGTPGATPAA